MNVNLKEIGYICDNIRKQRASTMLEKIKKVLEEAAEAKINLDSETARALLAREIILTVYGEVKLDG